MIWESFYWKRELQKLARSLAKRCNSQRRWPEASLAKLEQEAMIGCFIVRKLIEAYKISTERINSQIKICAYSFNGKHVPDYYNWYNILKFYNFDSKVEVTVTLMELCNQMIHSYIFLPLLDEDDNRLHGILFSSDRKRNSYLYEIKPITLANLYMDIANDYPTKITSIRGQDGQFRITSE